jgi:putative spermidine/putrescine transport system substrate-binding protein
MTDITSRTISGSGGPSRRRLITSATAGLALVASPMVMRRAHAQDRKIVIRGSGGALAKAYDEYILRPFTKETRIEAVQVTSGQAPINMIKGMVDTKTYSWDMAEFAVLSTLILGKDYLETLGLDNDLNVAAIPANLRNDVYVPMYLYPNVFGYREDAFKGRKAPQSWADFYDVKNFPARRSLRRAALDTFENALLADGVTPDKLYPLDTERAIRKLNSVKKDIAVWWENSPQSTHVLASNEVDMVATWSQRIQPVISSGERVKIVWKDGYYNTAGWGVLKGTPKADLCRELIKFSVDPQRLAAWTPSMAVGPVHPKSIDYIAKDVALQLPTHPDNLKQLIPVDQTFWAQNRSKLEERFDAWLLS